MKKHEGIAAERDPEKHRVIRKQLVPAFNPRALKEQEPALHTRMDTFIEKLALSGNNPKGINMPEVSIQKTIKEITKPFAILLIPITSGSTGSHLILQVIWLMAMTLKMFMMVRL